MENQVVDIVFKDGRSERRMGPCVVTRDQLLHESVRLLPVPRHIANANQHALIQFRSGEIKLRRGPLELILDPFKHESIKVRDIVRYVADPQQYVVLTLRDGRKQHFRGPSELLFDPMVHEEAKVEDSVRLSANEAIVVYRRLATCSAAVWARLDRETAPAKELPPAEGSPASEAEAEAGAGGATAVVQQTGALQVERRVVRGPAVFMPEFNEWLHAFSWHGSIKDGKGSKTGYAGDVKVPHALNFKVLRCMPDQIYYSVREVRTMDDASLTVHLMLFYELVDIETMLDATTDLVADICNAASADVMTHAAGLSYEQFLVRSSELSSVEAFPILRARMAQVGNSLLKVVYRGYSASAQLQEMHDEAITRRTRIRLEADQAREEQEKLAMELRCRQERSRQELELEAAQTKHRLSIEAMQAQQEREQRDAENAQALRYEQERRQASLAETKAAHDEEVRLAREQLALRSQEREHGVAREVERYEAMQRLGVDLTQYLTAQASSKPDAHLRIDGPPQGSGAGAGGAAFVPNVHLSLPAGRSAP
jgi:hypothetical protein